MAIMLLNSGRSAVFPERGLSGGKLIWRDLCRKLQEEMDADDLLLTDLRQNHLTDEKIADGEKTYKKLCEYFKTIPGSTI